MTKQNWFLLFVSKLFFEKRVSTSKMRVLSLALFWVFHRAKAEILHSYSKSCGGCGGYIHMDDENKYGVAPGAWTLEGCITAVQGYSGTDGCMGSCAYFEEGGYCNCPTDACEENCPNENAGGPGQLYCTGIDTNQTCASCPFVISMRSTVLGALGWTHWITFHLFNNGFKSLWDPGYFWTPGRARQLGLTLALAVLQIAGGSYFLARCSNVCGHLRNLANWDVIVGCWGSLWAMMSLVALSCKKVGSSGIVPTSDTMATSGTMATRDSEESFPAEVQMAAVVGVVEKPTNVSGVVTGATVVPPGGLVDRLKDLQRARDQGLLTEQEHAAAKAACLRSVVS